MVTKDYAGNLLVYPKTIDNNGFFQCLIDKTNYNKKKGHKKSETIRSALGMEKDVKISFQEMPIIVDYFSKLLKKPLRCRIFSLTHKVMIEYNIDDTYAELIEIYLGYKDNDYKYAFVQNPVSNCKYCGDFYSEIHPWDRLCDKFRIDPNCDSDGSIQIGF